MASGKQETNACELGIPQWKKELLLRRRTLTRAITSAGGMVKLTVTCPTALRADSVPVVQSYGKHHQCTLQPTNCSAQPDFHPDSSVRTMRLLDADLPGSELIAINCNSNSDSDLKAKMVEEKPDKKPTFKNMEKQKEEKNLKAFINNNDNKNEDDYHSDSSEELQYGPGIVNKLKSKYLSMTLRDNQKHSARPSLSNLRRATSLENMLDDDSNRLQQKPHFIKKPYHSNTQRSSKISQHHAKYLGLTRGSESMKRARSMDTLLKSDSKTNLHQLSNSLENKSIYSNGIIAPSIINEDLIIVDNCPETQEDNKLVQKVEDKELPPQDLVKQTLKIFETSTIKKQSTEVQSKVKTAVSKLSNSNSRPNSIDTLPIKSNKPSLSPKPLLSPEKRFIRPKVTSPKRVFPVVSSIDKAKAPVIAPRVLSPGEAKKFPFSPKVSPTIEMRKFIIPTSVSISPVKTNVKERTVTNSFSSPQILKEAEKINSSPVNINVEPPQSPQSPKEDKPKYISQKARDRISKEGLSMKFCFSDKAILSDKSYLPQNINEATNTALISSQEPAQTKQVAVIRPVVKNKMLTEQEIEKNLINKAKSVESKIVKSDDTMSVSEKPQLWDKKPWQSQNTMVFNFSDRKSVPDYIENDGLTLPHKKSAKCNGEETDGAGSGEEDWDPPLTCNVRFIGDNILINGKSSLKKEPRPSKLRIQFNDEATTLFEYPSEESMSEEVSSSSSPTPSNPLPCNVPQQASFFSGLEKEVKKILRACQLVRYPGPSYEGPQRAKVVGRNKNAGGLSLQLTELKVPRHANLGDTVVLQCLFELGRGSLYSVKWYKDDDEFYRFMPDSTPQARLFELPGVLLDEGKSTMSQVTLTKVDYSSSGAYRCEVSTEAPDFETALQSKNMTVVVYPDGPPIITGVLSAYSSAEEHINANCTTGRSNPAPVVSWYVNGIKMSSYYTSESPLVAAQGLYSMTLALRYPLSRLDSGRVTLNCSSAVAGLPPLSSVLTVRVSSASAKPAKQRLHNAVASPTCWPLLLLCSVLASS